MRVTMRVLTFSLFFAVVCVTRVLAQDAPAHSPQSRADLALGYSYLHSNLPPGGCGCFGMNGGSAQFTMSTFTVGTRYRPVHLHGIWQPFGELLVGGSHASGSLASGTNPASGNATLAFALISGGGIDLHISRRFSLRLVQADYLLTTFDNGSNNHQNNLRVSAGVVVRLGR